MRQRSLLANALALPLLLSGLLVVISLVNAYGLFSDQVYGEAVFKAAESWGPQRPPLACEPEPVVVKSIWPAVVELDPETLRIKDGQSWWELTKGNANTYGNYTWGLGGQSAASLHFLHTICNLNNGDCVGSAYPWASIYNMQIPSGAVSHVVGTEVSAFGLAEHDGEFYFAFGSTVARRAGGSISLPEPIGGLDYVGGELPFLLAITREPGSHKIWQIDLTPGGDPAGSPSLLEIQAPPGSPLQPYAYTGIAYARIPWGSNPDREVLFVSKDDGTMEPLDRVAIVDFDTGEILHSMGSAESGRLLGSPVTWENGVTSYYLNWANPQGLEYIDGRLFVLSRFYWNKGAKCEPAIQIEKNAASEARYGETLAYEFHVTNVGQVSLYDITVLDDVLGDLTGAFSAANEDSPHLDLGASVTFAGQYTIPWDAPDPLENTVTASGRFQDSIVEDSDSHSMDLVPPLVIEKSGPDGAEPGDTVEYVIEAENRAASPLMDGLLSDEKAAFEAVLGETLFQDDFNSGALAAEWESAGEGATWSFTLVGPGNYARRHTTGDPPTLPEAQMVGIGDGWADYSVSLDLRVDTANRFPGGVRVRVDRGTGAGYSVWLYPVDGRIRLWKSSNWQLSSADRVELASAEAEIGPGWHHLRVDLMGDEIAVVWDGEKVIEREDGRYLTGTFALEPGRAEMLAGVTFGFDNISIHRLPAVTQPGQVNTYRVNHTLPEDAEGPYENSAKAVAYAGEFPIVAEDDYQLDVNLAPGIEIEKSMSLDRGTLWQDADEAPGPEVPVGTDLFFKLHVANTGTATLTNISLSDSDYVASTCPLTDPLEPGASFECILGPFPAEAGQNSDTATAAGQYHGTTVQDTDSTYYFGRPRYIDPAIQAGADDTHVYQRYGRWYTNLDGDYVLITANQWAGLRFDHLDVPQGATITSAYLELRVWPIYDDAGMYIYAQAEDNPSDFSADLVPSRPRTAGSVLWAQRGLGGGWVQTPDLSAPIQEVVDRQGWTRGNALAILLRGAAADRLVFDQWEADQGASAARLNLTYDAPQPNAPPIVLAGVDQAAGLPTDGSPLSIELNGEVSDDGLPDPPGAVTVAWSHVAGPAGLAFEDAGKVVTTIRITSPGTYTLRLTADDGEAQGTDELVIRVTEPNQPPVASDDLFHARQDELLGAKPPGVLANDSDPEGGVLGALLRSSTIHGSVTLMADGSFHYMPGEGFVGEDVFTYAATDGEADSAAATVTIVVERANAPPMAVEDHYAVDEDQRLVVTADVGLLSNDSDADGDDLRAVLEGAPPGGTFSLGDDGSFTYTPPEDSNGAFSFSYRADDGRSRSHAVPVRITVCPVNDPPEASSDEYSMLWGETLEAPAPGVLANDVDSDGDALSASLADPPSQGSLDLATDGSFEFTPPAEFSGVVQFTYRAKDGLAESSLSTVSIDVVAGNRDPEAEPDSGSTQEDTALVIDVLTNDSDPDGDTLRVASGTAPAHGSISLPGAGLIGYMPDQDFFGIDRFSYTVLDDQGARDEAQVVIEVVAVNDPPQAVDDATTTRQDTPVIIPVLNNDTDVEGQNMGVIAISSPAHGGAEVEGAERVIYTPEDGFAGMDEFIYTVRDGEGAEAQAVVSVTVEANCAESLTVKHLTNLTANYAVDLTGREYLTARLLERGNPDVSPVEIGVPEYTGSNYSGRYVFEFIDGEMLVDEGGRFMTTAVGSGWRVPLSGVEGCHSAVMYVTVMHNRSTVSRFDIQAGDLHADLTDSGYGRHSYAILLTFSRNLDIIMAPRRSSTDSFYQLGAVVLEP